MLTSTERPSFRTQVVASKIELHLVSFVMQRNRAGESLSSTSDFSYSPVIPQVRIKPGGTVVEGTAGNTGIGLAHVCRARGYKCVIFMPDTQASVLIQYLFFPLLV